MSKHSKRQRQHCLFGFSFLFSIFIFTFIFAAYTHKPVVQAADGNAAVPLFELASSSVAEAEGGADITLTFHTLNSTATTGSVWIPEEQIVCNVELTSSGSGAPSGNLNETALTFDINGDGDTADTFPVKYVDNSTAEIDGATAQAQLPPGRRVAYNTPTGLGFYYRYDKTSFQLGSKTHTLHKITYPTSSGVGYAEFGLSSTFQNHPSPCLQLILEQVGESITDTPAVEIVNAKINGAALPVESTQSEAAPHEPTGQWLVDKTYAYSLGALEQDETYTVTASVRGAPGTYLLMPVVNWSPDGVNRYRYANVLSLEIKGNVNQNISLGNTAYSVEVSTNCAVPQAISYDLKEKTLSFTATGLGTSTYFWNVTIPQELLKGTPWAVTIAGSPVSFTESSNSTHTFLYFSLDATALPPDFFADTITIKGTWTPTDTLPPHASQLQREPAGTVTPLQPVKISISASDVESSVANVTLYYLVGNATSWSTETMTLNSATNLYEATISGQEAGTQVKLRIIAYDSAANSVTLESEYTVEPPTWAPAPQEVAIAATVSVGATAVVSTLASAIGSSVSQGGSKLGENISDVLPKAARKWLSDSISSKRKIELTDKAGSKFILSRTEIASYAVSITILTLAFAYARSASLGQIFEVIPLVLATTVITDFVRSYLITSISRHMGVWTEQRVWYLGLVLFAFSTLVFKVPFSWPSRLARYSQKMTRHLSGLLSSISVVVTFGFAFVFLVLYLAGFTLIGNVGLIMCLTKVLFDVLPIPPMSGKNIFNWNKIAWLALFTTAVASYGLSLFIL
jgi:hypothetical protein